VGLGVGTNRGASIDGLADPNLTGHRHIPLSAPSLGRREHAYVDTAMNAGWISGTGPFVREFEQRLGVLIERDHVLAVANGTLALELALRGLDVGADDEVIVPALTFAAPACSVLAVGARPVLTDVCEASWTLCPDRVAERITPRTKAIIAVDVMGHPADYDELARFGLPVIEDAAEAHGARYKGRPAGSLGNVSVFSFHANKPIATGEGGCVGTDSVELAERMRLIANHGMRPENPYVHEVIGRNFRMTNLIAAVGLGQLDRWDELLAARNHISREYDRLLAGTGCQPRPVADWATYSCWLHTVTTPHRTAVVASLRERGIDARAIWPPLSAQPLFDASGGDFEIAADIAGRALWLPTFADMTAADVEFVTAAVRAVSTRDSR